jgi:MEMO1 family protein
MKISYRSLCTLIIFLLWTPLLLLYVDTAMAESPPTRLPEYADAFYLAHPATLKKEVEGFIHAAPPFTSDQPVRLIVAPHAGYRYSGAIAGVSFKTIQGQEYDAVILIAFRHRPPFNSISVIRNLNYLTPLGMLNTHQEIAEQLIASSPLIEENLKAHNQEHSLEVLLPFLQVTLKQPQIVPIMMASSDYPSAVLLADALVPILEKYNVLIVASTDLSHHHTSQEAEALDQKTHQAMTSGSSRELNAHFRKGGEACGRGPLLTSLLLRERMGWNPPQGLAYTHSGAVTGDHSQVVGYGSFAIIGIHKNKETQEGAQLTRADRASLLSRTRASLEIGLQKKTISILPNSNPALEVKRGCFVTLWKEDQLRGCIGRYHNDTPLYQTVQETSLSSALHDNRFNPVSIQELDNLTIEISVLTEPQPVDGPRDIVVGRDGIIIQKGNQSGTFLPKVGERKNWTAEEFLSICSAQKVGIGENGWKEEGVKLFTYQSEDFKEE